jgi:pyrimidine-nucleoside phosphorylase
MMSDLAPSLSAAREILKNNIDNKNALQKLGEFIQAQGGDPGIIKDPTRLPQPPEKIEIKSERSGYVEKLDALEVGMTAKILGAGRNTKDEVIDPSIGILLKKKVGDRVEKGDCLAIFHSDGSPEKIVPARQRFRAACTVSHRKADPPRLFYARLTEDGIEEFGV